MIEERPGAWWLVVSVVLVVLVAGVGGVLVVLVAGAWCPSYNKKNRRPTAAGFNRRFTQNPRACINFQ